MKKTFSLTLLLASTFLVLGSSAWGQDLAPSDEFMLEEITVTAEKRAVNLQELPSSVVAIEGTELVSQGKVTTEQFLEGVPNVVFNEGDSSGENPNGNITIRGVQKTQSKGGDAAPAPSATATYVDGVYQGVGGNYDVNRIEVLRGPQGTLYGRSATGGVVAFYTNDPKLSEFSGNASVEVGTAELKNVQAAVNAPIGDTFAIRVAAHYLDRGEGYYNGAGGATTIKEGRIKALYEPTETLKMLFSLSATREESNSGGYQPTLTAPDTIDYKGAVTDIVEVAPRKYLQGSLRVDYDFSDSSLTYIGAMHTFDNSGPGGMIIMPSGIQTSVGDMPENLTHTEELRWASNSEGPLTWFIGSNFYEQRYENRHQSIQVQGFVMPSGVDPDPNTLGAEIFTSVAKGSIKNYGLFTEETYALRNDFRITAGLRYDKTKIHSTPSYIFNTNINSNGNSLKPENNVSFTPEPIDKEFDNVTYKLRLEYDLTPDNMLYALTATGFLPGDAQISPNPVWSAPPFMGGTVTDVEFMVLPYDEEKLTSYELGSKNRFFGNRLQLNGSAFYYDYEGKQEAANTNTGPGAPIFVVISVPVRMIGVEMDATWLVTAVDKVSFAAGWLDAEYTDFPDLGGSIGDTHQYMALETIPGIPEMTATLGYDHTFTFGNGSTLVPRAEAIYTKGLYVNQMTRVQADSYLDYMYQDDYTVGNIGLAWNSPSGNYSVSGYIRNITDEEYKKSVQLPSGPGATNITVDPGDPRTWGLMINAKF